MLGAWRFSAASWLFALAAALLVLLPLARALAQSSVGIPTNAATGRSLTDAVNQNEKALIDREVLGTTPSGGGAVGGVAGAGMTSYPTGRLRTSDHDGLSVHNIQLLPDEPPGVRSFSYTTTEASAFANITAQVPGTVLGGQLKVSGFIGQNDLSLDLRSNSIQVLGPDQSGTGRNESILAGASVLWSLKGTYALASLVGTWGQTTLKDGVDDCSINFGCNHQRYNFNTSGLIGTLTAGQIFDLGGGVFGPKLDLRGSVGYTRVDPANFFNVRGDEFDFHFSTWTGTVGLTLFANMALEDNAILRPYISGYLRQEWDYRNGLTFTRSDGATSISAYDQAHSYAGVDAGLTYAQGSMTYGAAIYYEASGDERSLGGRLGMSMKLDEALAPTRSKGPFNWSGFYAGVNAGSAWGHAHANTSVTCLRDDNSPLAKCPFEDASQLAAVGAAGSGTMSDQAFVGGGQVGLNWQTGSLVYGLELDLQAFNLAGNRSGTATDPSDATNAITVGTSFHTDWLITARGRLGWVMAPNLLLYGTGGLAATELGVRNVLSSDSSAQGSASASGRITGWTVGGGAEWALSRNWTLRGEYLHLDFGKVTANASVGDPVAELKNNMASTVELTADIVRAGLNYKF